MVHPFTRIRELIRILPTVPPFLRRSEQNPPEPTTRTKGLKRLRLLFRFKSLKRNETASVHFANEQEHIGILISETTVVAPDGPSDGQELQDNRVMLAGPIDESGQYDTERIATTITSATSTPMLVGEPLSGDESPPNYEPQPRDGENCLIAPVFHFALLEDAATVHPSESTGDQPPRNRLLSGAISLPAVDDGILNLSDHPPVSSDTAVPGSEAPVSLEDSNSETLRITSSPPSPEGSDTVSNEPGSEPSFVPLTCSETPDSQSIPTVVQDPLTGFAASEDGAPRFSVIKGIDKLPNEHLVEILARLARSYWLEDAKLVCGLWYESVQQVPREVLCVSRFSSPFYTIQTEEPDVRDQILSKARRIINSENFDEVSFVIDERPSSDSLPLNLVRVLFRRRVGQE